MVFKIYVKKKSIEPDGIFGDFLFKLRNMLSLFLSLPPPRQKSLNKGTFSSMLKLESIILILKIENPIEIPLIIV